MLRKSSSAFSFLITCVPVTEGEDRGKVVSLISQPDPADDKKNRGLCSAIMPAFFWSRNRVAADDGATRTRQQAPGDEQG
jgi:hypothetical protein